MSADKIELLGREALLRSYLEVDRLRFRHRLFAGGMSGEVSREVLLRGAAVVVMPYDVERDRVVLVEQFRVGAYVDGEPPWLLEAIAGLVEPGEEPAQVAIREAREEAGLALAEVHRVLDYYASPGALSERAILFWAPADTRGSAACMALTTSTRTSASTSWLSPTRCRRSRRVGFAARPV